MGFAVADRGSTEGLQLLCAASSWQDWGAPLLRMMQAQRDTSPPEDGPAGGFAMLTALTRDGIVERIEHRWSDKIGEPIDRASRVPDLEAPRHRPFTGFVQGRRSLPADVLAVINGQA